MRIRFSLLALSGLTLGLSLACGGEPDPVQPIIEPPASAHLTYTDPTGSGWRLVEDASSTSTRLVLNLVGPAGTNTRGVGFNLQAPASVKFDTFPATGRLINDLGVYQLLSAAGDPSETVALTGGVKPGNILSVGIFQKDRINPAVDSGAPLCQIAIKLNSASIGASLPLAVIKAKVIPEDIGTTNDDLYTLGQKMKMADITIAVGSLSAH